MRRSSRAVHFLAATAADANATATANATAMASRPRYRGGRSRGSRGFSNRAYNGGRSDQLVTGDSHYQSVRGANLGFRRGEQAGSLSRQPSQLNQGASPHFNQNQRFRPPPRSPFNRNLAPRPSKPLDYRSWEYAKTAPPRNCEKFVVLSYNILADYLANNHRSKLYFHIPPYMLDWEWRKHNIMFELRLWSADILCFQEVDRYQELEEELKYEGYSGIWKMRTGNAIDGCAVFWRTSRFKLVHEECIEFNKVGLRDNVAQICVLELLSQNHKKNMASSPTSSACPKQVVICNIHVLYNPKRGDFKLGQVRMLLDRAHAVSNIWNNAPVVICGDFNCTPKSPLYNFILEQKLDLSGVDRDKVSGQASAEIHALKPSYSSSGNQTDDSKQALSIVDGKEVGVRLSDSLSNVQNENNTDKQNNLFSHQSTVNVLDASDKSGIGLESRNKESTLPDVKEETVRHEVDGSKDEAFVSVDSSKGSLGCLSGEDGCSMDQANNDVHTIAAPFISHEKNVCSDVTERNGGKGEATSHSLQESVSEHVDSDINMKNEGTRFNSPTLACVSDDCPTDIIVNKELPNTGNSEVSSTEALCRSSLIDVIDVSHPKKLGNWSSRSFDTDETCKPSALYQTNESIMCSNTDFMLDKKLENLYLVEPDAAMMADGCMNNDEIAFVSASHNDEDSETVNVERSTYDPSLWTPMEIATATGNQDSTLVEHPLQLKSTYAEVEDYSQTRDSNGEPVVTSYNRCFMGTVDYIWRSEGLQTVKVLAPIRKHAMQWTPGFPTKKWGSDHIALASELAFVEDLNPR
ncbi:carbon catabolite repressor protein 4 homolog 6 isoform X2 [Carica papaya]|uniref:carbon catabolite repressor protein 4 homolog 6 isoform X2 n=1 Tax=Carica papaya TaxID=3649 RepID=UPI000B8CF07F|nr:carbon catabolite repressor protein 4 homolog 6 isoform X2 [Carica papaya]